jgi:hypothetical protein
VTKEEDHDIDPDPKRAAKRPLVTLLTLDETVVTKEEDHDIDPDPKRRPGLSSDWAPPEDKSLGVRGQHGGKGWTRVTCLKIRPGGRHPGIFISQQLPASSRGMSRQCPSTIKTLKPSVD